VQERRKERWRKRVTKSEDITMGTLTFFLIRSWRIFTVSRLVVSLAWIVGKEDPAGIHPWERGEKKGKEKENKHRNEYPRRGEIGNKDNATEQQEEVVLPVERVK
jgi:hypothetical protein